MWDVLCVFFLNYCITKNLMLFFQLWELCKILAAGDVFQPEPSSHADNNRSWYSSIEVGSTLKTLWKTFLFCVSVYVLTREASYECSRLWQEASGNFSIFTSSRMAVDQQKGLVTRDCHLDFMTHTITEGCRRAGNDGITYRHQNKLKTHRKSVCISNIQKVVLNTCTVRDAFTHISPLIGYRVIISQSDGERHSVLVNQCKKHPNSSGWIQGQADAQVLWFWREEEGRGMKMTTCAYNEYKELFKLWTQTRMYHRWCWREQSLCRGNMPPDPHCWNTACYH